MSVCITWKRNNKIYLISDSLISSKENITVSKHTPFMEEMEYCNQYYVADVGLKIYEINKKYAVAVAGEVALYKEILERIYILADHMSISEIKDSIINTWGDTLEEIELIFIYQDREKNEAWVLKDGKFREIVKECEPVFIGCGNENTKFTIAVKETIVENDDTDPNKYLALVISYVQCLSAKLKTISNGYGGEFYGLLLSNRIHWMRDMEYVLLMQNGRVAQSVSVIVREKSVVISSSMEHGSTRLLLNDYTSAKWYAEYHNMKSVLKSTNTKEAFYYLFYNSRSNKIFLWEAKGILVSNAFRKWVRRNDKSVDYLYAINPELSDYITSGKSKHLEPKGYHLEMVGDTYMAYEDVAGSVLQKLKNIKLLVGYDFDFCCINCKSFNKEHIRLVRKDIQDFYNIVLIDYDFFCKRVLSENLEFYENTEWYENMELDLSKMQLELLLRHCLQYDQYPEMAKTKFVIMKGKEDHTIKGINITEWFQRYKNSVFIESDNLEEDFAKLLIYMIKEYYLNDKYFHLGKNIIISDNEMYGQILELLVPLGRRDGYAADWILVRMNNYDTKMPGGFNYVNEEYAFLDLLNLNPFTRAKQGPGIEQNEEILLTGADEEYIHDWKNNDSLFKHINKVKI